MKNKEEDPSSPREKDSSPDSPDLSGSEKERAVLVLHSGAYDRASYALSMALVALAMGMEVHILFTYGGLSRLVKGHSEEMGQETDSSLRPLLEKALATGRIPSFTESLREAKKMGLKVYACAAAMALLNVSRQELIAEVDQVTGLAKFLELAKNASLSFYI